jgi:pyridoxal phosphate enzyme (YggS family)
MEPTLAERLERVMERISTAEERSCRPAGSVQLVAVTKRVSAALIREAALAGVQVVGENYVQECRDKYEALSDLGLEWHLIGGLQTNKAKLACSLFDMVETVDRVGLAQALNRQVLPGGRPLPVLAQVWLGGGPGRSGVAQTDLPALVDQIGQCEGLLLRGLMGVPEPAETPSAVQAQFARLRQLSEQVARQVSGTEACNILSMGMSGDFEMAIAEGATQVRIGSAIFGERPGDQYML